MGERMKALAVCRLIDRQAQQNGHGCKPLKKAQEAIIFLANALASHCPVCPLRSNCKKYNSVEDCRDRLVQFALDPRRRG